MQKYAISDGAQTLAVVEAETEMGALDAYADAEGFVPYSDMPEAERAAFVYQRPDGLVGAVFTNYEIHARSVDALLAQALALGLDVEPERADFGLLREDVERLHRIPADQRPAAVARLNDGEAIDDARVEWYIRKSEAQAVAVLLAPLPSGAEFTLGCYEGGRAYRALYRKNAEGLWDQIPGTCEAPHIVNMDAAHLGFAVGVSVIRSALARVSA